MSQEQEKGMDKPEEGLARVEERGEQANKLFVVVLCADENGRKRDLRSFGVEGGGRYDPVREKAERFAERINAAHASIVKPLREKAEFYSRSISGMDSILEDLKASIAIANARIKQLEEENQKLISSKNGFPNTGSWEDQFGGPGLGFH